ncbi:hypothetical protein [Pseudoflavonifractor phocaeensis]|uniref:hypothetical protein n=1 Tax=Pseudoflavonifractor phocaeensis TaxID=1870988 RepID=UPI00195B8CB2|nr:hypothetical protein [Pseudoflavonifractor phocaeensis]MBM6925551.1 hypothetical protein [Pseudoflavonifractor phocaeensis]
MNNDRDAILLAIRTCTGINPSQVKIARIRNTLELFEIQVSPALYQDLQDRDDIDLLEPPRHLEFDQNGFLLPFGGTAHD